MISRSLPAEGCGERTCWTQAFQTDWCCGPALFFIALKWLGALMVIIGGDRLPLTDAISRCWYTGDGDSAFSHTNPQFCWVLISNVPIRKMSSKIYFEDLKKKKKNFLKKATLQFFSLSSFLLFGGRPDHGLVIFLSVILSARTESIHRVTFATFCLSLNVIHLKFCF